MIDSLIVLFFFSCHACDFMFKLLKKETGWSVHFVVDLPFNGLHDVLIHLFLYPVVNIPLYLYFFV